MTKKDDNHKDNYKEIFEELVKERFDEITELTDKIIQNDLLYCFKSSTCRKIFNGFNNDIELFKEINFGEMRLEESKKLQNELLKSKENIKRKV